MIIYNSFKKMLVIQVISAVIAFLNVFIDSVVISRFLGTVSMASFGFAEPMVLILSAISMVFAVGTQGVIGKLLGKGDIDGVNEVVSLVISLTVILSVVFTILIFIFSDIIVMLFGASGEMKLQASIYLKGFAPGVFAILAGPTLTGLMQIDNDIKRSFYSVAVMTLSNIILDVASACVFKMGMLGMALATTFSSYINIIILLLHFKRKDIMLHPKLSVINFSILKNIISIGFPAAIQQICIFIRTIILNILLFKIAGDIAVAAFTIQNGIIPLVMAVINGIGLTTILVSGTIIGEEDRYSLIELMKKIFKLAIKISLILFAIMFIFAKVISLFFVDKSEIEEIILVTNVIRLYSISIPLCMIVTLFVNYFQSMQKLILANVIYICEVSIFVVVVAYILSKYIGMNGVWIAFIISEILSLLLIFAIIVFNKKRLPNCFEDFLMIPYTFGLSEEHRINVTITDEVEATEVSKNIMSFCEKHGIDKKRTLYSALSMEELTVFTLQNNKNSIKCKVDVFVAIKGKDLRVILKDNGKVFNPVTQKDLLNPEDRISNVAIRLFYSIVKDVKYKDLFGLNVISFKI